MSQTLTIISKFSNSEKTLERYFEQMQELQELLAKQKVSLKLVLGYGDSQDNTEKELRKHCVEFFQATLIDVSHGKTVYGSVVSKRRFIQLARIGNTLWNLIPKGTDYVGVVESDLIWRGVTLAQLLDNLQSLQAIGGNRKGQFMVAPMVLNPYNTDFYDTFAFIKDGINFEANPPYHPRFNESPTYIEMDSVGSCFFTDIRTARFVEWPEVDVVVGLCRQAREAGTRIFLWKDLEVYHP